MKPLTWLLAAVLVPASANAQTTAERWPGLHPEALPTVYVLDDAGVETTGRLLRLTADSLVLLVDDTERTLDAARVRRIQKRGDSLRNGALIGTLVGIVMGAFAAGLSDCPRDANEGCAGFRAAALLISTGMYAAIGTGIDALIVGRTTVYHATATAAPPPSRWQTAAFVGLTARW
jgi:hypothetical protein